MIQWGNTGGWLIFILTTFNPAGVHLLGSGGSVQPSSDAALPSQAGRGRPLWQRAEAAPAIGTYMLNNPAGKPCIKATMGAEYIVNEKRDTWYFNLDPSRVDTSGDCGKDAAVLRLTLPDNAASLQFTFRKDKNLFYVDKLVAHVSPPPGCQGRANKTYSGSLAHEKLFAAGDGQSFHCRHEQVLRVSSELRIKLLPLQVQAFTLPEGQYGAEVECWSDFYRRVIPVTVGATLVGLVLIAVLTSLFIRDRRAGGYVRL
uniref:Lysosome-associated membrane glycoprotein 2-like luminal domain-containing protein n=1 Tax=Gasterosteus aculeatus aculeatus TaxID=481459 RepID=A0AAQ4RFS9_GASAC|nr:lysosome-associated membrane glycoprotein 3 isoform X1 [Gasterosteus aculeatus aculeatus]